MSIASLIRLMAEAGATPEAIAIAVEAIESHEQKEADRKAKRAEQKRQERDRRATVARQVSDSRATPSPKERSPTPPKEITPSSEPNGSLSVGKARANDLSEFRNELSDLDPERLEAVIKHRRSKRGQLTGHAARLFRSDADACGLSLSEAVDTCISRNWITVKPEYLASRNRSAPHGHSPPRDRQVTDALDEMARGTWKGPPGLGNVDEPDYPYIETSFNRRN